MINKNELIKEHKDCADMLGMSLNEYQNSLKNTKVSAKEKDASKVEMLKKKNYNL